MSLRLGDTAPDFEAETTEGTINFHDWIGDGWAVLFSHPADFTPVCTTELGETAKLKEQFAKRNCKVIAVSVDSVEDHKAWAKDIEETQGCGLNLPLIGDTDRKVSELYDMICLCAQTIGNDVTPITVLNKIFEDIPSDVAIELYGIREEELRISDLHTCNLTDLRWLQAYQAEVTTIFDRLRKAGKQMTARKRVAA